MALQYKYFSHLLAFSDFILAFNLDTIYLGDVLWFFSLQIHDLPNIYNRLILCVGLH